MDYKTLEQFGRLFRGREDAWGTGKGVVIRGALTEQHYAAHLAGHGPGLGIFPLMDDARCYFAAVDLDEPDLDCAYEVKRLLPPQTYIEQSRSGNYHIWAFFEEGIDAWIPRALMKNVLAAVGKPKAEVFPKQDRLMEGMLGNYINLPYHGNTRNFVSDVGVIPIDGPHGFMNYVTYSDPARWQLRCERLGLKPQAFRERDRQQGSRVSLHRCAGYIIHGARSGERPIVEGHRHIVLFNLAKMLLDYEGFDDQEAWEHLYEVNDLSPDPVDPRDLRRLFNNAKRGGYTSTGCDDPVMAPYVDPECHIAHRT